jgi:hypothetical protein
MQKYQSNAHPYYPNKNNYPSWRRDRNLGLSDLRNAPRGAKIGDPQKTNTLLRESFDFGTPLLLPCEEIFDPHNFVH